MRVGSCHETTEPVVMPMPMQAGGDPLGPVAELAEGDRLAVRRDEHGVVGRRRGSAVDELPHGAGAGEYLARGHGLSFRDHSHSSVAAWRVGPAGRGARVRARGTPAGQNGPVARRPVHSEPHHLESGDRARAAQEVDRRHQAALVGVAVAVILLVWFAVANLRKVQIDFWVFNRQAPLILVIVISGLLGALITALIMRRKPKA